MSLAPKKPEPPDNSWMDTYGDMVTLLLCFFILLASISKVDSVIYEQVQSGMTKDLAKKQPQRPIQTMKDELTQVIEAYGASEAADVGTDERGLVLHLTGGNLFKPGSAEVRPELRPVLKEIADTLSQPRFANYQLDIQGHTDDMPVTSPQFPTNWDLSAARAIATLKVFSEFGIQPSRMTVQALAEHHPRVPNRSPDGTPYPENQALNRRIQIHVFPK